MSNELTFKIRHAKIPEATIKADVVSLVFSSMLQVVKEYDNTVIDDPKGVEWYVTEMAIGSAAWAIAPQTRVSVPEKNLAIVSGFIQSLSSLEQQSSIRPRGLGDEALAKIRNCARKTTNLDYILEVGTPQKRDAVSVGAAVETRVSYWLDAPRTTIGSIEGHLEMLQVHDKERPQFAVWDRSGQRITCYFNGDILNEVITAVCKRVRVKGHIRRRRSGIPQSVAVKSIRVLPEPNNLPTIEEMTGIVALGMRSDQYVRELRDAE